MLDDLKFWMQIIGDSKRTVYCSPDLESRVRTGLDARGLGGWNVVVRPYFPEGQLIIVDMSGLQAEMAKELLRR